MLIQETFKLRAFSFAKIPLLFFTQPAVEEISEKHCVISMPHKRVTQNHLKSLYFGALCIGADVAGGILADRLLRKVKRGKGALIFKDFQAKFLKRSHAKTYFRCTEGEKIQQLVKRAEESLEREEMPVQVEAFTLTGPQGTEEKVAEFVLTLSVKVKL